MKRLFFRVSVLMISFLVVFSLKAQQTDSWINESQSYFKILSATDGIAQVPVAALTQAGVPVSAFAPQNVQIFFRGEEIPIYIKGETHGSIEYIEFISQKNDGWLDTGMYVTPLSQTNPHFSQVTDTSAYFLTWNNSFSNARYQPISYSGNSSTPQITVGYRDIVYQQQGRFYSDETGPEFGTSDGWFSLPEISLGGTTSRTVALENKANEGVIRFKPTVVGISDAPAPTGYNHHLQIKHGTTVLLDTTFSGRKKISREFFTNASDVGQSLILEFKSINDLSLSVDRMAVAVIEVDYPALFNISPDKQTRYKIEGSNEPRKIIFTGLTENQQPTIYIPSKNWRLIPTYTTVGWAVTIPASDSELVINVGLTPNTILASKIKPAQMVYSQISADFIVVTHSSLMSSAQQYASYRGGFTVDVDVLYNRYAYGINGHPLAIRYFLKSYIESGHPKPTYLFLIGKGIALGRLRANPQLGNLNLVPVCGAPPSDMLLTTRLTKNDKIPEVMVGRLAALTNEDVNAYLNKVREHAEREPSLGAKNVLHMGGGNNAQEQQLFAGYLRGYETIITDTLFGGFVSTFLKNSSLPIIGSQSDSIRSIIENGPLLMTFFGHGWTGGFDQNIDEPESFNNQGKYPLIIANSCYSGDLFNSGVRTVSENWILTPNRGAIVFLASVHLGYPSYLNRYAQEFYKNIAWKLYGESFGKSILQANIDLINETPTPYMISNCLEFIFHGDPAVVPVTWPLPDPMLGKNSVKLFPQNVTTEIDSFAVNIIAANVGRALSDSLSIYAERLLPNGQTQTKIVYLDKLYYSDTVMVYFPIDRSNAVGINRINVMLDYLNEIEELSETNNQQTISFSIASTDIYPIYPLNFALHSQTETVLKASTGNPFEQEHSYIFQYSTQPDFEPSNTVSKTIQSGGGVVEYEVEQELLFAKPYFWRVAKKLTDTEQMVWHSSTFVKSGTKTGWAQINQSQFSSNELKFMEYNHDNELQFVSTPRKLRCNNIGSATGSMVNFINFDIDGNQDYGSCAGSASIVLVVIDSITITPWKSDRGDYGHIDYPICFPRTRPNNYFTFQANETGRSNMVNFLNNVVEHGNYVLAYSVGNAQFETWTNNDYLAFETMGATAIRTIPNNYPYIFVGKKGFPDFAEEVVGDNENAIISIEKTLTGNFYYGFMTTPWIGPAREWGTLNWSPKISDYQSSDSVLLNIYAKSATSADSLIASLTVKDSVYDISFINNLEINYLKFEYFTYDLQQKTPVPPEKFMIEYVQYPELAINPNRGYSFHADKLIEGDSLALAVAITNVTEQKADQFQVNYKYLKSDTKAFEESIVTIDSLQPFSSYIDTIKFSTLQNSGNNFLQIEANYPNTKLQSFPEPFTFNNIGWKPFRVTPDDRQPILTVMFDGRHVMNNEIVSSRPDITITLNDQNPYIPLNDTSVFEIWLLKPDTETAERIWFDIEMAANRLNWYPPTGSPNECKVIWNPIFDTDGFYELQVKAKDMTGNTAGDNSYAIRFEVVNRSTITHLLNYPNPFTTSTRFAFTITGHRLPDELRIQIFTVSGRVVREIEMSELGPLRIGQNLTQFAWDGTDQYGDRLANGIYFFRVISTIDGTNIEHRSSGTDKFFKKEFGKMFLMK